jgi:hypothetical protein
MIDLGRVKRSGTILIVMARLLPFTDFFNYCLIKLILPKGLIAC